MTSLRASWVRPSNGRCITSQFCSGVDRGRGEIANLAVDTLVKADTKTPPVDFGVVSAALIYFRGKVRQSARLACQRLARSEIGCDVLQGETWSVFHDPILYRGRTRTKSAKWTCPSESNRTLSGLTSRWMMPCEWIYFNAQPSSAIQNRIASSVKHFLEIWNRRSPPFIKSTTM